MPEHVTGQVTKHLAPLTYLLVGIIIVGSYFDFILYANGDGLSSCSTRCLCMEKQKLVNCTDRAFREIPSDLPLITVRLTLDWNFIEALSAPSFSTLHSLENFSIAHNRVSTIKNGTFESIVNLTELLLSDNQLTFVPYGLQKLSKLTYLDLSQNRISKIAGSSFSSSLIELQLAGNYITIIDETSFKGLKNIEILNLRNNRIHIVDKNVFVDLPNLRSLDLIHNAIRKLPRGWLGNSSSLSELLMTGNKLIWMTDVREWYTPGTTINLDTLFLNKNHISSLPGTAFRGLSKMETLCLNDNHLQNIHVPIFDALPNLELLLLSNNRLQTIPSDLLANNAQLKNFVIRGNNLKRLPANLFANNMDLELVDMAGNTFSSIPKRLFGDNLYPHLNALDIRNNVIKNVPFLANLPALVTLIMSGNRITKVAHTVFDGNPLLEEINLDYNQLRSIDRRTFANLSQLESVSLRGNDFMCDCKIVWLLMLTYRDIQWAIIAAETVTCTYPYSGISALVHVSDDDGVGVDTIDEMNALCQGPKEKGKYLMISCIWILVVVLLLVVYWSRKVLKAQKRLNAGKPKIERRYSLIPNKVAQMEKSPWSSLRRHSRKKNGNYTNLSKSSSSSPPRITVSCLPHSGMVYKQQETTV